MTEIKSKKYEFSPSRSYEKSVAQLSLLSRSTGALFFDADIKPGQVTDIAITPDATGEYVVICDDFCSLGHGDMKMTLTVVQ